MFDLSDFAKLTNSDSEDESDKLTNEQQYEEKQINVHDEILTIREFHFSTTNAGYVWPSTFFIIDYILKHSELFKDKRIIELGSGTGILSLFLKKKGFNVTSSDIDEKDVTENNQYNQNLNNVNYDHIPHTWGEKFPEDLNNFDIVIASDIILYVAYFEKLMITLRQLMDNKPGAFMLMSYKRKLYNSKRFFVLLTENDFEYEMVESKTWIIRKSQPNTTKRSKESIDNIVL
ncbi:putative methyltransferase [Heterostelium album PN500]|uniref:Putative methyltransferase n=1 Tax=Heterostelium pallidum (strain ATCC 26659 / Pp 5 / PN500) TaxID=670386 RepID=D3BNG7_HETP5|nr:putative methyltransferase [Heterostelium album PN500]EFA76918.1 putative methyltransferase [Heterostelium album PN500]|eukprot:XP_020429050.1 putative methyltransferase [Heterostelium album PN500]